MPSGMHPDWYGLVETAYDAGSLTLQGVVEHFLIIQQSQTAANGRSTEVGGGLGLNQGAPKEATPNLCAPTVLDDWLVAGHSNQPVIVLWRRCFSC